VSGLKKPLLPPFCIRLQLSIKYFPTLILARSGSRTLRKICGSNEALITGEKETMESAAKSSTTRIPLAFAPEAPMVPPSFRQPARYYRDAQGTKWTCAA